MVCIDVHTHMMNSAWVKSIEKNENYGSVTVNGKPMIALAGRPYMPVEPEMLDYQRRINDMNTAGVDLAIISLTTPSVYWADLPEAIRLSQIVNKEMADQQRAYPDRIRFLATLPWQHPDEAKKQLLNAVELGAIGVFVGSNIEGTALTDNSFAPIWSEIDKLSLPVLLHPSPPVDAIESKLGDYNLIQSVGFMCDTSIAVSRMIFDGFFDRYPNLKLIAAHVGGTLPFIAGRLDACYDFMAPCREKISNRPSEYLQHIYYDSLGFTTAAIQMCLEVGGPDHVMFGSDYPHLIGHMDAAQERVKALPTKHHKRIFEKTAINVFNL
jgi:aminocarboxymuconate-semialdehyde decarboxylase